MEYAVAAAGGLPTLCVFYFGLCQYYHRIPNPGVLV